MGQRLKDLLKLTKDEYCQKYRIKASYYPTHKYRIKKRLIKRSKKMEQDPQSITPEQRQELENVRGLLKSCEEAGLPVKESMAEDVKEIRLYQQAGIDKETGRFMQVTNHYVRMKSEKQEGKAEDVLRQVPPLIIRPVRILARPGHDKRYFVVPDMHAGYRRYDNELVSLHDEKVVDVGLQLIRYQQPDLIILNGDVMDMADLSTYPPDSEQFRQVMQATLDRVAKIIGMMRASSPNARMIWLEGNHEARLAKRIAEHYTNLLHLKRPGADERYSWLSIPHLMRLDDLGVEYFGGYPSNSLPMNKGLQAIHGDTLRSGGSTAHAVASREEVSTLFGHNHRIEMHARTNKLGQTIIAASFGTWGRIDGTIPSKHNAVDEQGHVVRRYENWQNGAGTGTFEEGKKAFTIEPILIDHNDGYKTKFDGKVFRPKK